MVLSTGLILWISHRKKIPKTFRAFALRRSESRNCGFSVWLIYNGNWTEWSAIWSEFIRVISKSNERVARVWFEITSMISDQNCMTRSSIAPLLDSFWNRTIFGEKQWQQSFSNSRCKILHKMILCLSFSWNFIDFFNRTLASDWLFCFTFPFSLAEKKMRFRAKIVRLMNKSHQWEPIRLQG